MRRCPGNGLFIILLIGVLGLTACDKAEPITITVTEVIEIDGAERIVTRVVRQTVPVTVTPNSAVDLPRTDPVELDISLFGQFPDIDPQKTSDGAGIDLIENLYAGLTRFDHESSSIVPVVAKEWDVSPDGRTWTFHLRDDFFWVRPTDADRRDDGLGNAEPVRQVVAADFVFAIQRACLRDTDTPDVFVLYLIQGCEQIHENLGLAPGTEESIAARALDDFTLEIGLTKPAVQFLTVSSMWLMRPIPRELVAEQGDEWQSGEVLVTNGPFILTPTSRSSGRATLLRNPLWPIPHRGNVDAVNVVFMSNEMNAYQLWEAKRLDVTPLPDSETARMVSLSPLKTKLVTEQTLFYFGFNFSSGALREPEVRRALNAAIDRELLVDELYGGRAIGMRHLAPPGVLAAPPIDEVGKGYDPDFARQQMSESGFRSCRLMPPLTLLVSSSDLSLQQAELIREMWVDELGCLEEQFIIEQVQFGTLLANTRQDAGDVRPDMWELGWASYYPDSHNWAGDLLHCADSENRQGRACSEVDDLIHQASGEKVVERRVALYRRIEEMFFGSDGIQPLVPLYAPGNYELVQSWLSYEPALFGGEQYDSYIIAADLKRLEQSR